VFPSGVATETAGEFRILASRFREREPSLRTENADRKVGQHGGQGLGTTGIDAEHSTREGKAKSSIGGTADYLGRRGCGE
jgi:hypothetical protein